MACGICSKHLDEYSGGVWMGWEGKKCSDHTISIAGYGTTTDGLPYCKSRHPLLESTRRCLRELFLKLCEPIAYSRRLWCGLVGWQGS